MIFSRHNQRDASSPGRNEPMLRAGAHTRFGRNVLGTWFQGPHAGTDFSHPFTVVAFGSVARISKGIIIPEAGINPVEPMIGSVPISGYGFNPQPSLKLDTSLVNEFGESWVCVEVTPDPTGKRDPKKAGVLDSNSKVEVVQRDSPIVTGDSLTGRAGLALLTFRNGMVQVFQIVMFNLKYGLVIPPPGEGVRKHHFV